MMAVIHSKDELSALFRHLANHGVRRLKGDTPYDTPEDMRRLLDLRHGQLRVCLHIELRGANCRRVEVGTQPRYEIVCD